MIKDRDFSIFSNVNPKKIKSSSRIDQLNKLAATIPRKDIDLELKKIRNDYSRAKTNYDKANSELSAIQQQVDNYQVEMNLIRQRLVELNKHVQNMDLTNADGIYSAKDETFYVVDGKRYHVDCADVADIKMTPIKEWRALNSSVVEDEPEEGAEQEERTNLDDIVDDIFLSLSSKRY